MPIWRQIHANCNCIGTHRHRSRQSSANRRTFVHVIFELVYYRGTYRSVSTEDDFRARDTAWVWTNATPIEPLQRHSSQSCANLMSIQCQSSANLMSIHHQSEVDRAQTHPNLVPIPTTRASSIHWQSSANPAQIHFQLIGNQQPLSFPIECQSMTNLSPFHPFHMPIWWQFAGEKNANSFTFQCQSVANRWIANTMSILGQWMWCQSICQSIASPICQSIVNL